MLPYLSVIVPVRNERKMLPGLIDQLLEQNYPPELYEIIVVDGRSEDGTADLVRRRYSNRRVRVRVLDNPTTCSSAGRNAGIRAASGDAMIFLTGHCTIPTRELLADTAEILETTGAGCLCRPEPLLAAPDTRMGEAIARARATRIGRGPDAEEITGYVEPLSSGETYLQSVFQQVGLFDENFDDFSGLEFNERVRKAGVRAYSDPRLAVHEKAPQKLRGLLNEMFQYGRGMSRFMRKHPERSSVADIAPLGVLLAVLLALFAWSQLPAWMAGTITLPLAMFPVAVLITSMQIGARYGFRSAWRAPLVFATIYFGQGFGLLYEYVFPDGLRLRNKLASVMAFRRPVEGASKADRAA
jgi:succinoglycan biosynthesis protein ExoA